MQLIAPIHKPSPALLGLSRKSLGAGAEDAAILRARLAARGIGTPLPVFHDNRVVAVVQGRHPYSDETRVQRVPYRYNFAYTSYDDMISEMAAGKVYTAQFGKTPTSAGVANNWYDLWPVTGNPTAGGLAGTAATAVQVNSATAGAIYVGGDVSTDVKYLLSVWAIATANTPTLILYDRVLTYDSCVHTNTANQAMTNGVAAQRYISAGEPGLQICCAVDTVQGATATNLTQLQYTDNDGNATQSMPTTPTVTFIPSAAASTTTLGARIIAPITSGATVPWGPFLPLASGDAGARLIANYTTSSSNTGTHCFIMMKPLAILPAPVAGIGNMVEQVFQVPGLPRIYDGACISLLAFQPATTAYTLYGGCNVGWG